jgi:glycosyltransferase involved in cell wall biosynthesis
MDNKVLICSGIFPPDIGGPAFYVPLLADHLKDQNSEVTVFTYSDAPEKDNYKFKVVRKLRSQFILIREFLAFLNVFSLAQNADVVYANGQFFKSALAARIRGKKLVAKIVGDEAWERLRNWGDYQGTIDDYQREGHKTFKMKFVDWLRAFPLTLCDEVIVPSNYLKRIVENWHPKIKGKVRVVYNSFNLPEVELLINQNPRKKMVTVCRLVNWKGVDRIIGLLEKDTDLSLTVVGGGPLEEELKALSQTLGVSDKVHFTGNVDKAQVAKYMNEADIFILNSTYEGLPHVVLEAMSLQLPVIATDVGGTGEVVKNEDTGLLIAPDNDEQLMNAVQKLKSDESFANDLAQRGYNLVCEEFSKGRMLNRTTEILKS